MASGLVGKFDTSSICSCTVPILHSLPTLHFLYPISMDLNNSTGWSFQGAGASINQNGMAAGSSHMNLYGDNFQPPTGNLPATVLSPSQIARIPFGDLLKHHPDVVQLYQDYMQASRNTVSQSEVINNLMKENADLRKELQDLVVASKDPKSGFLCISSLLQ